jgi:TPR repeat protein
MLTQPGVILFIMAYCRIYRNDASRKDHKMAAQYARAAIPLVRRLEREFKFSSCLLFSSVSFPLLSLAVFLTVQLQGDESEFGLCALGLIHWDKQLASLLGESKNDFVKARNLFELAPAKYNGRCAMYCLGQMAYLEGDNYAHFQYIRQAAKLGYAPAQCQLALLYCNDQCEFPFLFWNEDHNSKVREYFRLASDQGHPKALYYLGSVDLFIQDEKDGLKLFAKSTAQYFNYALPALGDLFKKGLSASV